MEHLHTILNFYGKVQKLQDGVKLSRFLFSFVHEFYYVVIVVVFFQSEVSIQNDGLKFARTGLPSVWIGVNPNSEWFKSEKDNFEKVALKFQGRILIGYIDNIKNSDETKVLKLFRDPSAVIVKSLEVN